jgi:hypothetical protein
MWKWEWKSWMTKPGVECIPAHNDNMPCWMINVCNQWCDANGVWLFEKRENPQRPAIVELCKTIPWIPSARRGRFEAKRERNGAFQQGLSEGKQFPDSHRWMKRPNLERRIESHDWVMQGSAYSVWQIRTRNHFWMIHWRMGHSWDGVQSNPIGYFPVNCNKALALGTIFDGFERCDSEQVDQWFARYFERSAIVHHTNWIPVPNIDLSRVESKRSWLNWAITFKCLQIHSNSMSAISAPCTVVVCFLSMVLVGNQPLGKSRDKFWRSLPKSYTSCDLCETVHIRRKSYDKGLIRHGTHLIHSPSQFSIREGNPK